MRRTLIVALLAASCFAQSRTATRPPAPSQDTGRYQIFFSPNVRADTFLVDTQTGKIWRMQQFTDLPNQPTVWAPEKKFDTDEELDTWMQKELEYKEWLAQHKGQHSTNTNEAPPTPH